jgi:hypothetical protein
MSISQGRYVEVTADGSPTDPQAAADLAAAAQAGAIAGDIAGAAAGAVAGAQAGTDVAAAAGAAAGATAGEIAGAAAGTASGSTAGAVAGAAAGGPAGAAAATALLATRTITGGGLATGGGTLAADRVITVTAANQAEAETGTATNVVITPQRWVNAFEFRTTAYTRGLLASADDAAFRNAIGVPEFQNDAALTAAFVLASVQMMTLAGTPYVRTSLVDILAAGYTAASYKRSADRFLPNGTTNATNGGYWLNAAQQLRPEQFGLFTNRTVTTATLQAANDFAVRTGRPIHKRGTYLVNGPCIPDVLYATGSYNLVLEDHVTLDMDAAATACINVLGVETTAPASHSITGASLTILAREKAARGVWFRHYGTRGGNVMFGAPIRGFNLRAAAAFAIAACAVGTFGRFIDITGYGLEAEEVTRDAAGGETNGLVFSQYEGLVSLYTPRVAKIRIGAGTGDADGIKCVGYQPGADPQRRMGRVRIYGAIFEDCQGRSYKDQTSGDSILYAPVFKRDGAVMTAISGSHEADFQFGGGLMLDATVEYKKGPGPGFASPLSATSDVFSFQQLQSDHPMYAAARNTTIMSDVQIPRIAVQIDAATAAESVTEIIGLTLIPTNGLTGSMTAEGILKVNLSTILSKSGDTTYRVKDVVGPNYWPLVGYEGASAANMSAKLIIDVGPADNPLGPDPAGNSRTRGFGRLAGTVVTRVKSFRHENLNGYYSLYGGGAPADAWYLDFTALGVGSDFTVDIAAYDGAGAASVVNPPGWGATGYAHIFCRGQRFSAADKVVEVWKNGGQHVYRTASGGVTWL